MVSENPALLRLGGEKKELTVIFTDIRGFTSISEMLDPEALVEFLNEYLGAMTDIVFAHGGLLDKYIGDAIMALWGTPLPAPDHAASACRAALDMTARLQDLRQEWKTRGLPPLEIGVGINTGPMVVGNMGSSRRFNYTVMGDQVNLGSRLEGLNKFYGTRILLSESTRAQLGEEFLMREVDAVRVKGKRQPVVVFELLARAGDSAELRSFVAEFEEALRAYKERRWEEAYLLFLQFAHAHPDDQPTQIYLERCRQLMASPAPADWDGVFEMEHK
jgi:adenylate cyclase